MRRHQMNLIKLTATLFLAANLSGCSGKPIYPCVAHTSGAEPYNDCFDLAKDFDSDGNLIAGHKGVHFPLGTDSKDPRATLDKHVNFDPDSWANAISDYREQKNKYKDCLK